MVTNAHLVWPFDTARVVFPDGTEFDAAPVVGWDMLADLAVLGPLDVAADALPLVDGEDSPIGTDLFLIGYPAEVDDFPQPTLVQGLLSRVREWGSIGMTYFQTDAPLVGGQSGGALVSNEGHLIGISGFLFTEANFGVVASAADISPRIQQIVVGDDPSALGQRLVPLGEGSRQHEVVLGNFWAQAAFVVNEPAGTEIDIRLTGDNDGNVVVYDSLGTEVLYLDDGHTGLEAGSVVLDYAEPHYVVVSQWTEEPGVFTLTSNRPIAPLQDPDDGKQIAVGQSARGNIDFVGDSDHFFVHLTVGETVEIVVSSILADSYLTIDYFGATVEQVIFDDDSGGGVFGFDASIVYRAPHTGSYFAIVEDTNLLAPGGYVITVHPAAPGAVPTTTTWDSLLEG